MLIRRELPADVAVVSALTSAAFRSAPHSAPPVEPGGDPGEVALLARLRADPAWIPELSMVAVEDGDVVGHVLATRARVGAEPVLALGPVSVLPDRQRAGVGTALMHAVLGAADALGEPLVGLLGDPAFYGRFGFVPADTVGVGAPDPSWGAAFQVRTLTAYAGLTGTFAFAKPFTGA
ncbi:N-acetyltransferase [Georgenia wutianyii]|uniref:N-acetyltransferase n=1 Tax=Georgenia wutianyii TaxID=2585135 RepID=A0ABX5VPY1_9MICO|nr:N-acetyltransferase [Georgenia wutianyii]QDB79094.1 N-acetyltransferase [Georgenia wutianyii]